MGCLALALALLVAVVRLWPSAWLVREKPAEIMYADKKTVAVQEIPQTAQSEPPPPPPPLPPVAVPDDAEIEEPETLDFSALLFPTEPPGEGTQTRNEGNAEETAGLAPEQGARVLRYPEAEYPRVARREGVRALFFVEVVVLPSGRVGAAKITKRQLLSGDGAPGRVVGKVGYGLDEAALTAARSHLFRPARTGGEAVRSRVTLTISFRGSDGEY